MNEDQVSPIPTPHSLRSRRRLHMVDIARLAGVSASTVSRALNGSPLISAETRIRIEELARSLNYTVHTAARNLRSGNNRTIAVVVPYQTPARQHISDPFFLSMLGSLADSLTDQGYDMLLSRVDAERLAEAAQLYESGRVAGIILIGQWHHHDQLNELAIKNIPLVVWGALLPRQLYCTVGSDNFEGGKLATGHLLQSGRRRIAFFGDIAFPEVAQRYQGYLQAHQQFSLQPPSELLVKTPFLAAGVREIVTYLLSHKHGFDAVFACSDLLAMTVIGALGKHGLTIPRNVAVVGYDDIALSEYFPPSLSTVRQPLEKGGQMLVNILLQQLAGTIRPQSVVLPTQLIVRESSQSN